MIYGLNFGGPDHTEKAKELWAPDVWHYLGSAWRLVGLTDDEEERDEMEINASNGHRRVKTRYFKLQGGWWGIYVD